MTDRIPSAWYADFFTELPNEFWRRVVPPEATAAEVAFIEEQLALAPGSRVLDVPCGSGRHALALAARGHHVTGVDISAEALAYARARAGGLPAEFHLAEMRDLPPGAVDAVIHMGNSAGYLDLAGTRAFLVALAARVRPGGGLVVDYAAAAESVLPAHSGEERVMEAGDIRVAARSEYDLARSRLVSRYRFTRGDEVADRVALHHVRTAGHLRELVEEAGFTGVELFGDTAGAPFRLGDGRLLLTARRAG